MTSDSDRKKSEEIQNETSSVQSRVEDLVVVCLNRAREEGKAVIDEILRGHADVADSVRRQIARLERLGLLDTGPSDRPTGPAERFGSFRLIRCIGSGGMGVVYLADQEHLGRRVALKLIRREFLFDTASRSRFRREAQAASQLDHQGICPVFEAGEVDGTPYIAMRYVHGKTLAAQLALAREGADSDRCSAPTSPPLATPSTRGEILATVELVEKAARAVHTAHEKGLIHRDLKPGNIMVTPDGEPVILDFGLARFEDGGDATLTQSGDRMGTPAYMAPEQVRGNRGDLDRRIDVYALGVILYECLAGKRPFNATSRDGLYRQILTTNPPDPRRTNPRISHDLKTVLETALEKDPDRRYQTAEALADDLRRVRRHEPIHARPVGPLTRAHRWARRHPGVAFLLVVLAIGVQVTAALGGYLVANLDEIAAAKAKERRDRIEGELERGFLCLAEVRFSDAIGHFEAALTIDPGTPEAVLGQALAHERTKAFKKALAVLDAHPEVVRAHPSLGRFRADLVRAFRREPKAESPEANGDGPHTALEHFVAGVTRMPRCEDERAEAFHPALRHFVLSVHLSREARSIYYFELAHAIWHAADVEQADRTVRALQVLWPDSFESVYWQGKLLQRLGDCEAASEAFRRVLDREPDYYEARSGLAEALWRLGKLEDAEAEYRTLVRKAPDRMGGYVGLGNVLSMQGKREGAVAAYRQATEIAPGVCHCHASLGAELVNCGRHEEAVAEFEKAISLQPGCHMDYSRFGSALRAVGRFEDAIHAYRESIRRRPDNPYSRNLLGITFMLQGETDAAIEAFESAIEVREDFVEPYLNLGELYGHEGRPLDALAVLRKGCRFNARLPAAQRRQLGERVEECELNVLRRARADSIEGFCSEGLAGDSAAAGAARARSLRWMSALIDGWIAEVDQGPEGASRLRKLVANLERNPAFAWLTEPDRLNRLNESERAAQKAVCTKWAALAKRLEV